jgi:hypothetical protein
MLNRQAERGRRCRIKFLTDVVDDYFTRTDTAGRYHVDVLEGEIDETALDHNLTLDRGVAHWSITLPDDRLSESDDITLQCTVTDEVIPEPIVNIAKIHIMSKHEHPAGGGTPNGGRTGRGVIGRGGSGNGGANGSNGAGDDDSPTGLEMPDIVEVRTGDSNWMQYGFDEFTACHVVADAQAEADSEEEKDVFTFYVNVDNRYLRTDMRGSSDDVRVQKARFIFGNVCLGLALIHDQQNRRANGNGNRAADGETPVTNLVAATTRAVAPFLVPMIDYLGALTADEVDQLAQVGDEA